MGTNFQLLILTLSSLLYLCKPQTINVASSTSKGDYLYVSVTWGTPPQSFKVLVDTTDHTSWVYNLSVNTKQPKFNPSKSSTFTLLTGSGTKATFTYQTQTTEIHFANDTLAINKNYPINTTFATAIQNFSITDDQEISGFLCLDRKSNIVPSLYNKEYIQNKSVSIDVGSNKLYFGEYVPSSSNINNKSNASVLSTTTNEFLNQIWSFDIDVYINGQSASLVLGGNFTGVIDSASPYITIYAKDLARFRALWILIGGSDGDTLNCNYTTRICNDINLVMSWMTIAVKDVSWNISFYKSDIIYGKNIIQFLYDNDTDYTTDKEYVLFLGKPFLDKLLTTMDYNAQTITFYSLKETKTTLNWVTIAIVFASVAAFSLIFFGIYYWKFGQIPPPSTSDVEEQSHVNNQYSLLRGPVQAVGSSQAEHAVGNVQGQSSGWSGISGLDDDNDEELQRQIQQAQRLSAIEAQQKREQQMRDEQIRQEQIQLDEQKQQAQVQKEENKKQQKIGGQAQKPQGAEELRQRRLKFLEEQQKKQQENDQ